ncbi:MAG: alpha/beta hydrolase [Saprospiraceae bacterium]|nr:alpha/beta hydrolase [Saprospiraceae bacterium]
MKIHSPRIITFLLTMVGFSTLPHLHGQTMDSLPLYDGEIPFNLPNIGLQETSYVNENGYLLTTNIIQPELYIYLPSPEKATGTSVIICPGGGYWVLAIKHEGHDFAKWFQEQGVAAFVLKYRLPEPKLVSSREVPLLDAQRALEIVRSQAGVWHLDPSKVGIMGFSAGGYLAAWTSTREPGVPRPDFSILVYPVIQMHGHDAHGGSSERILGNHPSAEALRSHSPEENITSGTPPAFLIHAQDDPAVPIENSLIYYNKLREKNVPASLFTIPSGGHGFGMWPNGISWMPTLLEWMQWMKLVPVH